jgi:hypothetical protein
MLASASRRAPSPSPSEVARVSPRHVLPCTTSDPRAIS